MPLLQHVFGGERLQAFSDAVFSIIATIMIIPLRLEKSEAQKSTFVLYDYLTENETLVGVGIYVYSFILVLDVWYSHCRVFKLVEKVDDIITSLNLLILLVTGFLPASIRLVHTFTNNSVPPVVLTVACCNIILINMGMCAVLFYAFRQQGTLHPELSKFANIRLLKMTMYFPLLINPVLAVLAIIFAWALQAVPSVAASFFFCMGAMVFVGRFIMWRIQKDRLGDKLPVQWSVLMKDVVSRERTVAFSDGVFAIVATLILLDLTTQTIPQTYRGTAVDLLNDTWGSYVTFVSTFVFIGLFWLIHHNSFEYIKNITSLLTMFNSLTLLLLGGLPFAVGVVGVVAEEPGVPVNPSNVATSVKLLCVLIVIIGASQIVLWICAHFQKAEALSSQVDCNHFENIHFCKLLIFPIVGMIAYWVTYSHDVIVHHFFAIFVIVTPVLFLLPNLFYILLKCFVKKRKPWMFGESGVYQIQGSLSSDTTRLNGTRETYYQHHNHTLSPHHSTEEPTVITTTAVIHEEEEEEKEEEVKMGNGHRRFDSDTNVV